MQEQRKDAFEYSAIARKPSTSLVSPVVIINRFLISGSFVLSSADACQANIRKLSCILKSHLRYRTFCRSVLHASLLARSKAVFPFLSLASTSALSFKSSATLLSWPFKAAWRTEEGINDHLPNEHEWYATVPCRTWCSGVCSFSSFGSMSTRRRASDSIQCPWPFNASCKGVLETAPSLVRASKMHSIRPIRMQRQLSPIFRENFSSSRHC